MLPELSRTLYIGVDPGKRGAIAYICVSNPSGKIVSVGSVSTPTTTTVKKFPKAKTKSGKPKVSRRQQYDVLGMHNVLQTLVNNLRKRAFSRVLFGIERQWSRPEDSKKSVQAMAEGYATWKTIATLLKLPITEISPTVWKPRYVPTGADKAASIAICRKLFPVVQLPLVKDSDRAEALLIADFLRRASRQLAFPREVVRKTVRDDGQTRRRTRRRRSPRAKSFLAGTYPKR